MHGRDPPHESWPRAARRRCAGACPGHGGCVFNLEFDLATGERGKRDVHVDRLFRKLLADESVEGTA